MISIVRRAAPHTSLLMLCALACCVLGATTPTRAQQQEDINGGDVRGAFMSSRPSSQTTQTTNATQNVTPARDPKQTSGQATNENRPNRPASNRPTNKNANTANNSRTERVNVSAVGLGYTLFMRGADGEPVRVNASRTFRAGDQVRLTFESNTDGYLYVFYTENGQNPQMIFPDARLVGGDNRIAAHALYEVPSSMESDERLRWFTFDDKPAIEKLYVVVTRQPLADVPTGNALINYCRTSGAAGCAWRPDARVWANVQKSMQTGRVVASSNDAASASGGQAQTNDERSAVRVRGATMSQQSAAPATIRMNADSAPDILVSTIDLIHK